MIGGTDLVVYLSMIGLTILLLSRVFKGNIVVKKAGIDKLYLMFFLSSLCTLLSTRIFSVQPSWQWQAFVFFVYYFILYLFYFFVSITAGDAYAPFINGIKYGTLIQIIYGYIQFLAYSFLSVDLNDLIFNRTLHLVEKASHYNYGVLVPSGFSWHPGTLAPLLVIAYCMFLNNFYVKILIITLSVLTQSSTCVIGAIAVVGLEIFFSAIDKRKEKKKRDRKTIILILIGAVIILIAVSQFNIIENAGNELLRIITRFQNRQSNNDYSTYYHMRYYTGLWEVAKSANFVQLLFGIGGGCSGYPYTRLFGQYVNHQPWDVESQIVADLINFGIVGFIILYTWMIKMAIAGYKLDRRYVICIVALLLESFTYNVRFFWVLIFLMFMHISIIRKENMWVLENNGRKTQKQTG